jgi:hypothetical protein
MKTLLSLLLSLLVAGCGQSQSPAPSVSVPEALLDPTVEHPIVWNYGYTIPTDGPEQRRITVVLNDTKILDQIVKHDLNTNVPVLPLGTTPLRAGAYVLSVHDHATGERVTAAFNPTNTVQIEIVVDPLTIEVSPNYMDHL